MSTPPSTGGFCPWRGFLAEFAASRLAFKNVVVLAPDSALATADTKGQE
jgi:hypothetical protein